MSGDTLGCHILGEGLSTDIYVSDGARDAAKYLTMQGQSPTAGNYPAPNVNNAKVEKPVPYIMGWDWH